MKQAAKFLGFGLALGLVGFLLPAGLLRMSRSSVAQTQALPDMLYQAPEPAPSPSAIASTRYPSSSTRLEVSLSRRQVSLYRGNNLIKSYPIAIGQYGWETPTGTFRVSQKFLDPQWIHPFTDELIPADDPRNPLGDYWIGFWSDGRNWIGFHDTPDPNSVGDAATHGCLRMYNHDISELYQIVNIGTMVVVNP